MAGQSMCAIDTAECVFFARANTLGIEEPKQWWSLSAKYDFFNPEL